MSDNLDLNVDNYTTQDLLDLFGLDDKDNITDSDIIEASNPLIFKYTKDNEYDYANFFQQAQNALLEALDDDETNVNTNIQNNEDTQIGNLWQNEYPSQANTDPNQADKVTDRKQQIGIFEQDGNFVMSKNQLGVSNTYNVPVAQGQLNPNLKNTTTRLINIDSQYRDIIIPYNPDPDGPSSATNFTLDLTDTLNNTISIELTSFTIPHTWYLIDASYQANNCFFVDSSNISINSGNYSVETLINDISSVLTSDVSGSMTISSSESTGKTTITNNTGSPKKITFYDPKGEKTCSGISCKSNNYFNSNLGWILGFRGNISISTDDPNYGQLIYDIPDKQSITSEALIDVFGSKYFLLVLDDYNQNHLNKGLVGITPTLKYAEIPSYWNTDLNVSCTSSDPNAPPTYVQNTPRKLTQAQLYTLNETTKARQNTTKNMLTSPTNTDVLALIPLRGGNMPFGSIIIDDFNLDEAKRDYFGPVDIERMKVKLVNDKGNTVNLNGNDWAFTLTATMLYQY